MGHPTHPNRYRYALFEQERIENMDDTEEMIDEFEQKYAQILEEPITTSELEEILKSNPTNKTPGPDFIPAEVLKDVFDLLSEEFTALINTT